ncbi:MAG: carotenoid 1,2-hydratase [Cyanobacteria bacterium SZAS LIN-2]|nr:carotenoid 1,2-hydratase [Cyanobacteria bacterium SZAS LIN-3]MBS1996880.1 carotenoid 1,2-hydratase [Cyanobacteria bacterium SZAS LIN-2]
MTRHIIFILMALLVAVQPTLAVERTYKKALPGYQYKFPEDHFSHDQFKTEWWYYTGHLLTKDNKRFGYELTFFRTGADNEPDNKKSAWKLENFYLAHFAVTDENGKKFRFYEKLNRAGLNLAGARSDAYYVFNEGWSVEKIGEHFLLKADARDYSIHLLLDAVKPAVIHGVNGVSQKASCVGCASHYYSMTKLKTEGQIFIGDKPYEVHGYSWMDHEFGSNQLSSEQSGWDWISLQLDDNRELMLYVLRRNDGTIEPASSGTVVDAQGRATHIKLDQFKITSSGSWHSPKSGANYPMGWHVSVPSAAIDVNLASNMQDQELMTARSTGVTYWEGSVTITGSSNGKPVTGQGYVEMTGYGEKFKKNI